MSLYLSVLSIILILGVDNNILKSWAILLALVSATLSLFDYIRVHSTNLEIIHTIATKFDRDWAYASSLGLLHAFTSLFSYILGLKYYSNNENILRSIESYLTSLYLGILTIATIIISIITILIYLPTLPGYYSFSLRVTLVMTASIISVVSFSLGMFSYFIPRNFMNISIVMGSIITFSLGGIFGVPLLALSSIEIEGQRVAVFSIPAMLSSLMLFTSIFTYSTLIEHSRLHKELKIILKHIIFN